MELLPIKANMTEFRSGVYRILFSYRTPVAYCNAETGLYYKTEHYWSQTTSRHINVWLEGAQAVTVPQETINQIVHRLGAH